MASESRNTIIQAATRWVQLMRGGCVFKVIDVQRHVWGTQAIARSNVAIPVQERLVSTPMFPPQSGSWRRSTSLGKSAAHGSGSRLAVQISSF